MAHTIARRGALLLALALVCALVGASTAGAAYPPTPTNGLSVNKSKTQCGKTIWASAKKFKKKSKVHFYLRRVVNGGIVSEYYLGSKRVNSVGQALKQLGIPAGVKGEWRIVAQGKSPSGGKVKVKSIVTIKC